MALDRSLRRASGLIAAPFVAVAAFLNAQAVSALVGTALDGEPAQLARAAVVQPHAVAPAGPSHATSAAAVLARNPFDHVTGPLVAAEPAGGANGGSSEPLDTSDPWSAPVCDGVDVDAIAASDDVDWSFASVEGAGKKSHLVRRGNELSGKTVYYIGWDRLWLAGTDGLCQAKVFEAKKTPPPVATPPPAPAAATSSRRGPKPLDPELRKGIQAVSATEFNIDRSVVDRILENQSELMRQARIIPVQENGRVVGVRMLGVRPDTLLGVLGMQDNDRLQTINGFEVANPEKALEAYARLRTADKLTIQINRAGKNMNLDYNIR